MLKGKWIWEHFKWPVLLLATLKGWDWPFTALLTCLLRFTKKLAGKKTNLCLRLCLNYTWHINSTERRQSRKLAAKEDRGGDQEWHRMSSNSSFYPLYIPALLTTGCCPTSPCSIFSPGWLQLSQRLLSDAVLLSVRPSLFVKGCRVWIFCSTASAFTNGCSLCSGYTNLSPSVSFLHTNEMFLSFSKCHVKLWIHVSYRANKNATFRRIWRLCQKPPKQTFL